MSLPRPMSARSSRPDETDRESSFVDLRAQRRGNETASRPESPRSHHDAHHRHVLPPHRLAEHRQRAGSPCVRSPKPRIMRSASGSQASSNPAECATSCGDWRSRRWYSACSRRMDGITIMVYASCDRCLRKMGRLAVIDGDGESRNEKSGQAGNVAVVANGRWIERMSLLRASGDGRAFRRSIPSAAWQPSSYGCNAHPAQKVKAHGFASPSFDGFALSRMKGVAIQARRFGLPQNCRQNRQLRLLLIP